MALQAIIIVAAIAAVLLAWMMRLARWLDRREDGRRHEQMAVARASIRAAAEEDHNPGGPLTERQARRLLEDILQAAIRLGVAPRVQFAMLPGCGHAFDDCVGRGGLPGIVNHWLQR